jgi:ribose transport system ATP-binding protein
MLRLQKISKSFSGLKALQGVSLEFAGAKVHAICGENGAGKSTLMNIIVGNLRPDIGDIFWEGVYIEIENIQQAQRLGIGIVYQERSLVDSLSVAENIFPVDKPVNAFGLIDYAKLFQKTESLLEQLQLKNISPKTVVGKLSAPQKQMVEIAKALAQNPSLLILDEPTASVTHKETETLFNIIRQLKARGVAIVYISHRMAEIKQIADVVTVLKDGCLQGTVDAQTPSEQLVKMMVGRELLFVKHESDKQPETKLEVKNLSGEGFQNVSFELHKGEIIGIAGLLGSGRTALARVLFGDTRITGGQIFKDGKEMIFHHPADAIVAGIAYIPDDRKSLGLFIEKTVSENIVSTRLIKGLYKEADNNRTSESFKERLGIKTPSVKQLIRKLSGGNQQKVVVAKWLNTEPDVLIINEPTHGVDVGAKADIYSILKKLTREGKSIIMISSELPELLLLADRIAVMYTGRLQKIIDKQDATEEIITELASGLVDVSL